MYGEDFIHLWRLRERSKIAFKLNIWDMSPDSPSSTPWHQCRQGTPVRGLDFSADGRYAATGEYGVKAHLWDLGAANPCDTRREIENGAPRVQLAFSSDVRWAAATNSASDADIMRDEQASQPCVDRPSGLTRHCGVETT